MVKAIARVGWSVRPPGRDEGKRPLGGGLWRELATGIERRFGSTGERDLPGGRQVACPVEDRQGLGQT